MTRQALPQLGHLNHRRQPSKRVLVYANPHETLPRLARPSERPIAKRNPVPAWPYCSDRGELTAPMPTKVGAAVLEELQPAELGKATRRGARSEPWNLETRKSQRPSLLHQTRLMRRGEVALWHRGTIVWQGSVVLFAPAAVKKAAANHPVRATSSNETRVICRSRRL